MGTHERMLFLEQFCHWKLLVFTEKDLEKTNLLLNFRMQPILSVGRFDSKKKNLKSVVPGISVTWM